ncbi:protein FAR1-RELATED SEQUENCE 5 [Rosa chinensis]|uniref:protein FAR1-RELATED SEQUENCE 5 n=1 Tax=Rosa chinensis TaxID=74649 RepID=UPI000D08C590|nr:protein FAR1-RELATED SEQUENCE 5 [Rosa chinensis]XP_024163626.1 protein FAR1-RELATED SEQUENCE 5 [Rosa chinensis]
MSNDGNIIDVESGEEDDSSTQDCNMETEDNETTEETYGADGPFEYNGKNFRELTVKDFDGTYFKTIEDAEKFYEIYSAALGFRLRRQKCDRGLSGTVLRRVWVCSKQGQKNKPRNNQVRGLSSNSRPPRHSTREKCMAAFVVRYSKELDAYYVKSFTTEHTHDLPKPNKVQSLLSHCVGKKVDLAEAVAMPKAKESIKTSAVHEHHPSGGNECVASTKELDLAHAVAVRKAKESINTSAAYVYRPSGGNEFVGLTKESDLEQGVAMRKGSINSTAASQHMVEPAGGHAFVSLTNRSDLERGVAMGKGSVNSAATSQHMVEPAGGHAFVSLTNRSDLVQTVAMQKESITTSSAYEYIVHPAGGYEFVDLMKRELYNSIDIERREALLNGDAQVAIAFMNARAAEDPEFFCKFSVDERGRLGNLFWRDSCSLLDYTRFGDVLIFDCTFKTNIYQRPLAVFVGANNHRGTVLFGSAILVDDTIDTYKWALQTFLGAMKDKKPISVLTDRDDKIQNAVVEVFPKARHRLCSWHIEKNLATIIKDPDVVKAFTQFLYNAIPPDEWDLGWKSMVETYGLQDNPWINMMYQRRKRWAEAFFKGHFFGGMSSMQRCQGIHRNLESALGKYDRFCEYIPRMDKTLRKMRNNISVDDLKCENSKPVIITHMRSLEQQIAEIFTHDIYLLIMHQIDWERKYIITKSEPYAQGDGKVFHLTQYDLPHRHWTVNYHHNISKVWFLCSCKLFQSDGIPCAHIFSVMKAELILKLPDSLVLKRWTMDVGKPVNLHNLSDRNLQMVRYASLASEIKNICFPASMTEGGTKKMKCEIAKLAKPAHDRTESQNHSLLQNLIHRHQLHVGSDAHSFTGFSVGINAEHYARSLPPGEFRTYFY